MTTKHKHDNPILVTGAAGVVGGIGRILTESLLARGHRVRAWVRREDKRAEALRRLGAEVVEGDLTDLASMHRAIEGCGRIYFGMSVSAAYLEATINTAAVARHHGVEAFVNMSQMTVTQMSITDSTDSPQHKLHWLAEQALSWSGLPVVTMRPTVFLDGFFRLFAAPGVRDADELALPMGGGSTSQARSRSACTTSSSCMPLNSRDLEPRLERSVRTGMVVSSCHAGSVFTRPGSNSELGRRPREVRSSLNS